MSQRSTYSLRCPSCGKVHDAELLDSINIQQDPDLHEALLANRVNQTTCPDCGFEFRVDKRLVYNDPARQLLIYLIPATLEEAELIESDFLETVRSLTQAMPGDVRPPQVHLVLSRLELVERIFTLEAGLDPRILEYAKYIVHTRNLEKIPFDEKQLVFNAKDSTQEELCFLVLDTATRQIEGMLNYPRQAIEAYAELFNQDEHSGDLLELFPGPYFSARLALMQEEDDLEEEDDA